MFSSRTGYSSNSLSCRPNRLVNPITRFSLLSLSAVLVIVVSFATIAVTFAFLRPIAVFFGAQDSVPDVQQAAMDYIRGYVLGLPAASAWRS